MGEQKRSRRLQTSCKLHGEKPLSSTRFQAYMGNETRIMISSVCAPLDPHTKTHSLRF